MNSGLVHATQLHPISTRKKREKEQEEKEEMKEMLTTTEGFPLKETEMSPRIHLVKL